MNKNLRIGIDIGGTNTDAVLINRQKEIIASIKTATTPDIVSGFIKALETLLKTIPPHAVDAIHIGTTHAVNAFLERKHLYKVGVIRLAGHQPLMLPPCCTWKPDLREAVLTGFRTVSGGFECDGRAITPLSPVEVQNAAHELISLGAESLAIVGVFSPLCQDQENLAASSIDIPIPISLSSELGGIGIVERENTTILNAALKKVMQKGFRDLQDATESLHLKCPLFITQNNGSLMPMQTAFEKPVLTISAGPTNSFIGAARLSCLSDAVVVDIGGTSTDIGMVLNGFPRRSLGATNLDDVALNFPMPDVISLAIGGGSHIGKTLLIGPESVGHRLSLEAMAFGGDKLTLTDAALKLGLIAMPGAHVNRIGMTHAEANLVIAHAIKRIEEQIILMQADKPHVPIVLAGGGAELLPKGAFNGRALKLKHAGVANAYGAALAQVTGTVDAVVSLEERESALQEVRAQAIEKAYSEGAVRGSVQIVDLQIIPYHYVPGKKARVICMAAGSAF